MGVQIWSKKEYKICKVLTIFAYTSTTEGGGCGSRRGKFIFLCQDINSNSKKIFACWNRRKDTLQKNYEKHIFWHFLKFPF